jgi:hypothetical protein
MEITTDLGLARKISNESKVVHVVMNLFLQNYESFIQSIIVEDELLGLEKLWENSC